jgi:SAM-dependent methyltransferase
MHWTEDFFVNHGTLYKKTLESLRDRAEQQIKCIIAIFENYKVPKNGIILDHCCGIGRHSILLAEKGYNVVGVDISPIFIERAKELAEEMNVQDNCRFIVGDVRKLDYYMNNEKFDAVISMFTSLGYYDDYIEIDILRQIKKTTKKNGILIIDTSNRDRIIKNFIPVFYEPEEKGKVTVVISNIDLEKSVHEKRWTIYEKKGNDLIQLNSTLITQRMLSLHEQIRFLSEAGWTYKEVYGDFDLGPFSINARQMITVSKNKY